MEMTSIFWKVEMISSSIVPHEGAA